MLVHIADYQIPGSHFALALAVLIVSKENASAKLSKSVRVPPIKLPYNCGSAG